MSEPCVIIITGAPQPQHFHVWGTVVQVDGTLLKTCRVCGTTRRREG